MGSIEEIVRIWAKLMKYYFRVDVKGLEHIPAKGRVMVIANHSGFAGSDAVLLAHILKRDAKRKPHILAHRTFFDLSDKIGKLAHEFGLEKAGFENGVDVLKNEHLLMVFPEGEGGNFKSSLKKYKLQEFRTGFIRMLESAGDTPVVPCTIVGAEESHFALGNLDLSRWFKNIRVPIPINWMPLPAKWMITFYPPMTLPEFLPKRAKTGKPMTRSQLKLVANKARNQMQKGLLRAVKERPFVYTEGISHAVDDLEETIEKTARSLKKKVMPKKRDPFKSWP